MATKIIVNILIYLSLDLGDASPRSIWSDIDYERLIDYRK